MPSCCQELRHSYFAASGTHNGSESASQKVFRLLQRLHIDISQYALGHSKIFLRAGVLGDLESLALRVDR